MNPIFFRTHVQFREWLMRHHSTETEIWVGFWKKASGKKGMTYEQALDEALCFGWIDGIVNKHNELSYKQRFTPRRSKSVWSKINTKKVERLIQEGKMMPSGMASVESAKADGRWDKAYDSPRNMKIPDDFMVKLEQNAKAHAQFKTLNKTHLFAIAYRLQYAKKVETRMRRMNAIIQMLENGETFH